MSLIKLATRAEWAKKERKLDHKNHPVIYPATLAALGAGLGVSAYNISKLLRGKDMTGTNVLAQLVPIALGGAGATYMHNKRPRSYKGE